MPWGLTRFHDSGQSHFVTFCCGAVSGFAFYGSVVMPEHVHLVLSEPQWETSSCRTAPLKPKDGLHGPPVQNHNGNSVLHPSIRRKFAESQSFAYSSLLSGPTPPAWPASVRQKKREPEEYESPESPPVFNYCVARCATWWHMAAETSTDR